MCLVMSFKFYHYISSKKAISLRTDIPINKGMGSFETHTTAWPNGYSTWTSMSANDGKRIQTTRWLSINKRLQTLFLPIVDYPLFDYFCTAFVAWYQRTTAQETARHCSKCNIAARWLSDNANNGAGGSGSLESYQRHQGGVGYHPRQPWKDVIRFTYNNLPTW